MKDRNKMPVDKPPTDVPQKPHEFPEYEDMPTDIHDDGGAEKKVETPGQDSHDHPGISDESGAVTNK